jgi:hypothetical protein
MPHITDGLRTGAPIELSQVAAPPPDAYNPLHRLTTPEIVESGPGHLMLAEFKKIKKVLPRGIRFYHTHTPYEEAGSLENIYRNGVKVRTSSMHVEAISITSAHIH